MCPQPSVGIDRLARDSLGGAIYSRHLQMSLTPGTRVGAYEILGSLGAGGMGQVFRARDPRLGRDVAIKVLHGGVANDPDRRRRFETEARAVAALNHPNVLTIYEVGTHDLKMLSLLLAGTSARRLPPFSPPRSSYSRKAAGSKPR